MPYAPVRYTLKYQADAWRRFFRGEGGQPRFKKRGRDSVTIPQDVRIRDGKLYFPKIGWLALRRRGGNPYPDAEPVQAVLKRVNGKWMAVVCYAVAATARPDDGTVTGVDMNVGQVAVSDGCRARIVHAPDSRRLETARAHAPAAGPHATADRAAAPRLAASREPVAGRGRGSGRGVADARDDRIGEGHAGSARAERPAESRAQPRHSGDGLGRSPHDARVQGAAADRGGPGPYQPDLRRVRSCGRRLAPQPGEFRVCGLRPRGPCRPERGPQHPASGTGAAARRGAIAFSDPGDP